MTMKEERRDGGRRIGGLEAEAETDDELGCALYGTVPARRTCTVAKTIEWNPRRF